MQPLQSFEKARTLVQKLGVRGTGTHVARKLLTTVPGGVASRIFFFVLTTPRPTPQAAEAGKHHSFRFATLDDILRLKTDPSTKLFDRDVESMKTGNRCLLQYDGDRLVGYTWIAGSRLVELMWGMHFNLADDLVYNYNGYTHPDYRGTAFQALRHLKVLEYTKDEGTRRLFGYVDHLNYNSLRGVQKSGYEPVGSLRGVKRNGKISFQLDVETHAWSELARVGPQQNE
ncbi:MAG TPA: hypothetical protein VJR89_29135 [Polyangiales bacterium]|nr:hypothetical protein [Polyangiales bacterium]